MHCCIRRKTAAICAGRLNRALEAWTARCDEVPDFGDPIHLKGERLNAKKLLHEIGGTHPNQIVSSFRMELYSHYVATFVHSDHILYCRTLSLSLALYCTKGTVPKPSDTELGTVLYMWYRTMLSTFDLLINVVASPLVQKAVLDFPIYTFKSSHRFYFSISLLITARKVEKSL